MPTRTTIVMAVTVLAWIVANGLGCSGGEESNRAVTDQEEALRRLEALPYVSAVKVSPEEWEKAGVTLHDPSRAFHGVNLYHDYKKAYLLDMAGGILHTWNVRAEGPLHHVELAENGDLLVVVKDRALLRVDRDSNLLWRQVGRFHHDVTEDQWGNLYALARKTAWIDFEGTRLPLLDDRIVILSEDGRLIEEISIGSLAAGHVSRARLEEARSLFESNSVESRNPDRDSIYDMIHTNSVELLPEEVPGVGAEGDILLCLRELDEIAVLDLDARRLTWSWGRNTLDRPHHGVPLEGGRILVYDNGPERGFTRILVIEPATGDIVWEHRSNPKSELFSNVMGSSQPLPNGNILITDSVHGRVLEVTANHEIVWEWFNRITTPDDGFGDQVQRLTIYRMQRLRQAQPPSTHGRAP